MDYRSGKCSQCGAEYKIPASFAHNHARCKVCKGVVRLEPMQGQKARATAEPSEARTAPATPRPGRVEPAAARAEVASPGTPESKASEPPAERPAATPSPGKPQRHAAEERAAPAAPPVRRTVPEPSAKHAPAPPIVVPVHAEAPSKAWILAGGGVLVLAAALYLFRGKLFGPGDAAATSIPAGTPGSTPSRGADEPAADGDGSAGSGSSEKTSAAPREHLPAEPAPEKARAKDPSSIDLAAIPDFGPTLDTSATEWTQMKSWATQWLDTESGSAGTRAKQEDRKSTRLNSSH